MNKYRIFKKLLGDGLVALPGAIVLVGLLITNFQQTIIALLCIAVSVPVMFFGFALLDDRF